jgi:hypothetical protein
MAFRVIIRERQSRFKKPGSPILLVLVLVVVVGR